MQVNCVGDVLCTLWPIDIHQCMRASTKKIGFTKTWNSWFTLHTLSNWSLQTVVDDWLDDYKQDREEGLLELFNFVVECCGCKGMSGTLLSAYTPPYRKQAVHLSSARFIISIILAIIRWQDIRHYQRLKLVHVIILLCLRHRNKGDAWPYAECWHHQSPDQRV